MFCALYSVVDIDTEYRLHVQDLGYIRQRMGLYCKLLLCGAIHHMYLAREYTGTTGF
jgi:hypothetical protein